MLFRSLSPLFDDAPAPAVKGFVKQITLGGDRIADTLLSDENRAYFANLPRRSNVPQPASAGDTSTSIAAEMEPLRRDWQKLMADIHAPSRTAAPKTGKIFMTSAPNLSEIFLRPTEKVLSPKLLKLLEGYQCADRSAPAPDVLPAPAAVSAPKPANVIWDQADLLKYAQGNIADVFGEEYALIDTYSRRVRLPMPPYLLVDRITKLDAKIGEYKPSHMTW